MDQQRTNQQMNTLGDLFLTETRQADNAPVPDETWTPQRQQTTKSRRRAPTDQIVLATAAEAALGVSPMSLDSQISTLTPDTARSEALMTGPAPARLTPKLPTIPQPRQKTPTPDALVNPPLRLVRQPHEPRSDAPTHTVRTEAVFLGNLPGFASPWMTQYAHHVAKECGLVGLLHIDEEQIDLDLVSSTQCREDLAKICRQYSLPVEQGIVAQIQALSSDPELAVHTWLIHLPSPLTEPLVQIARDLGMWTLLSGVDEAAGQAALNWLDQTLAQTMIEQPQRVQIMAMGGDIDRAIALVRQLDQRADDAFDLAVDLVGMQKQMQPVHLQAMGSFELNMDQWPQLHAVLTHQAPHAPLSASQMPNQQTLTPISPTQASGTNEKMAQHTERQEADPQAISDHEMETLLPTDENRRSADTPSEALATNVEESPVALNDDMAALPHVTPSTSTSSALSHDLKQTPLEPMEHHTAPAPELVPEGVRAFVNRLKHKEQSQTSPQAAGEPSRMSPQTPEAPASVSAQDPATVATPVSRQAHTQASPEISPQVVPQVPPQLPRQPTNQSGGAAPFPASGQSTVTPQTHQPPELGSFIASGVALEARCPDYPAVELVLDENSVLHLLIRHEQKAGPLAECLLNLIQAQQWVLKHLTLIGMSQRQVRIDPQAQPVLHLFTDNARAAATWGTSPPLNLKLHLLTPIHLADQSGWYCTPLN